MMDWLCENPNGSKDTFEKHFKALPADVKKVCNQSFLSFLSLILLCTQIYKDWASVAIHILVLLCASRV
jgi:hypothetical protein